MGRCQPEHLLQQFPDFGEPTEKSDRIAADLPRFTMTSCLGKTPCLTARHTSTVSLQTIYLTCRLFSESLGKPICE